MMRIFVWVILKRSIPSEINNKSSSFFKGFII